jgi:hypothetical protein
VGRLRETVAREPTVDPPVQEPLSRPPPRLLSPELVRAGGFSNAAVAAVIARDGPTVTSPAPVSTAALDNALLVVFEAAAHGGDWPDFAAFLTEAATGALPQATAAQKQELHDRAEQIAELKEAGGPQHQEYSIPAALSALEQLHASSSGIDGFHASAGLQHVARRMRDESSRYLADALTSAGGIVLQAPPETLRELLAGAVKAVHDGNALLALELDGVMDRLVGLRNAFAFASERDERKAIGKEIGVAARRALLLDEAARAVRGGNLLLDTVERSLGRIRSAEVTSADEDATIDELGDRLELLGAHTVDLRASPLPTGIMAPQVALPPELAFPAAVDRADESFQGDLGSRMETEAKDVAAARAAVIPSGREVVDLAAAHRRWFGFYSQEQEKLDERGSMAWRLMDGIFDGGLGVDTGDPYISIQQGFGRALLMPHIVENAVGGMSFDFVGDLRRLGPHRSERTSGRASSARYEFAEMAGPSAGSSSADEQRSRTSASAGARSRTATAMTQVAKAEPNLRPALAAGLGMAPSGGVPIAGAKVTTPEEGWSYLVDVYDETQPPGEPPLAMREHKVIAPEVVQYLLARQQQIGTLQREHVPRAGGVALGGPRIPGAKGAGLESGSGMAAEMYLEGAPESDSGGPRLDPTAARLQRARTAGLQETGANKGGGDASARAMRMLLTELRTYLDDWFIEHREPEYRIAAVLAIAQNEHDIQANFKQFMEAGELAKMVGKAIGIASALSVLSMLGPLGRLASMAIGSWLRSQGVSDITAMISIAAFLKQSAEASSLYDARGWALVGRSAAKDMASVLENVITNPLTGPIERLGKGSTPREVGDAIGPLIGSDPAQRKRMLEALDSEIAAIEKAHPNQSHPDREALVALRDSLRGESTLEGALAADTPLRPDRDKPKGLDTLTAPAKRSDAEWKALREAIGDSAVPIVENPDLAGRTVHVRYDDNGVTHVEIGRMATPDDLRSHANVVRTLRRYEGPVGRIRKLLSRILSTLQITPGFGDKGFESRQEIKKLRAIQRRLEAKEAALAKRLDSIAEGDPAKVQRELEAIGRELEGVEAQLKGWEESVDSFEKGRGIIAAVGAGGSEGPRDYRIVQVTPRRVPGRGWTGIPDVIPKNTVLMFPGGERIWRSREGSIVVESTLGRGTGRADYEASLPSRGDYDDQGFRDALYERAHSQGQGTGFESAFGIRLAPWVVNQRLQRYGIEEYLYRLRDQFPRGAAEFQVVTNTRTRERTLRMESIEYSIWVTANGQRKRLFEFEIAITGEDTGRPRVQLPHDKIWVNPEPALQDFAEHIDMDDIHERFDRALADMMLDGRPE